MKDSNSTHAIRQLLRALSVAVLIFGIAVVILSVRFALLAAEGTFNPGLALLTIMITGMVIIVSVIIKNLKKRHNIQ